MTQFDIIRQQAESAARNAAAGAVGRPPRPGRDGYVRRSPVQPVHQAADYRFRQALRAVQVIVLIAVVCVGLSLLSQLGVFGR